MASRIYNRVPLSVPTPSKGDINEYYFNHVNWKGVNTDKNFLTVDQETFADAKNVYVDGEGILRSRPAIKRSDNRTNVLDFWDFDEVKVTFTKGTVNNLLSFEHDGFSVLVTSDDNPHLVPYGDKIFVFAKDIVEHGKLVSFAYYDKTRKGVYNATDRIYIPKTKVDSAGVETDVESPNLFTDKSTKIYLYNKDSGISPDARGKDFSLELDGKIYNFIWDYDTGYTIVDSKFKVTDDHFLNGELMMDVRSDGAIILYNVTNRVLTYSVTGNSFTSVSWLDKSYGEIIGKPKFSQDGRHAAIATTKSLYFITLVPIDELYEYPNFTDVLADEPLRWSVNSNVVFDVKSYDDFVYAYDFQQYMYVLHHYDGDSHFNAIHGGTLDGLYEEAVIPKSISYNSEAFIPTLFDEKGIISISSSSDSYGTTLVYVLNSAVSNVHRDSSNRGNTVVKIIT
jgi:hypothetical protein